MGERTRDGKIRFVDKYDGTPSRKIIEHITSIPMSPHDLLNTSNITAYDAFLPTYGGLDRHYREREKDWKAEFARNHITIVQDRSSGAQIVRERTIDLVPFDDATYYPRRSRDDG